MQKLETDIFDELGKVPSFNTCLELKNLGFEFETEKAWYINGYGNVKVMTDYEYNHCNYLNVEHGADQKYYFEKTCPAPDFSELWAKLPSPVQNEKDTFFFPVFGKFDNSYIAYEDLRGYTFGQTLQYPDLRIEKVVNSAQAAAELLLRLIHRNLC